jgi:hypothetical protein
MLDEDSCLVGVSVGCCVCGPQHFGALYCLHFHGSNGPSKIAGVGEIGCCFLTAPDNAGNHSANKTMVHLRRSDSSELQISQNTIDSAVP